LQARQRNVAEVCGDGTEEFFNYYVINQEKAKRAKQIFAFAFDVLRTEG
jgi:hypothetical protein